MLGLQHDMAIVVHLGYFLIYLIMPFRLPFRVLTALRAKHADTKSSTWGVDGNKGELADMTKLNIYDPYLVKSQTIKTAFEAACMLLKIDEIVSGISKKDKK
eukprot:TRINITY_DN3322_c0_g1_i10.p1 TRINITY_DN3322_c0_g1~~TRINITY_DN3322_c0_g1_i10.p1  ORF type:complete len:102 (+),score=9.22 TRINITY_DN3322_c0_g1_i10:49-354(+)